MTVKIGKAVAIAVGGSIILLQIANEQGYVKVNWDKLAKKTDKIMDKVEERVTGEGPNLLDKVRQHLFRDFIIAWVNIWIQWSRDIREMFMRETPFWENLFWIFLISYGELQIKNPSVPKIGNM